MVEEQFKLGLTVEIEQKGLPELRKLIEKEVQQAISVSAGKIGKETGAAGGGKTRAAPGVSTAALKSAADTITVSAGDLAKKVVRLATAVADLETSTDKNSTIFKASADKIDAAIKKLVGAISGGGPVGPPTGGAAGGGGARGGAGPR